MKSVRVIRICALAIIVLSASCGPSAPIPTPTGVWCKLNPTRSIATKSLDLRNANPESLEAHLRSAEPNDLLIISSKIRNDEHSMAKIAAARKVKFALVADTSPEAAQIFLDAPIGKPQIVAVLPTEPEAVEGVFGATSPAAEKYLRDSASQYTELTSVSFISKPSEPFRKKVISEIRSGENGDMFVIIGHNEEGTIRGPDGHGISLREINEECQRMSRPAIILSCNTIRQSEPNLFVTTRVLEWNEVASALKRTQADLADLKSPNVSDFVMSLSDSLDVPRQQGKRRVVVLTVAGTLIVVITAYELTCYDNNPLCV